MADSVEPLFTALLGRVQLFTSGVPNLEHGPCHVVPIEQVKPILQQTLQLIVQRVAYPAWFVYNDPILFMVT